MKLQLFKVDPNTNKETPVSEEEAYDAADNGFKIVKHQIPDEPAIPVAPVVTPRHSKIDVSYDRSHNPITEGSNVLKSTLAGLYSVPEAVSQLTLKGKIPFIGVEPNAGNTIANTYNYAHDVELAKPNLVESIVTDPLTYLPEAKAIKGIIGTGAKLIENTPKVGKLLNKGVNAIQHVIDPTIQSVGEYIKNKGQHPENIKNEIALGTLANLGLGKVGKVLGESMKEGAISNLTKKVKLKPTDLKKRYAPELEVLFENGDIPWFGGVHGIHNNLVDILHNTNKDRTDYLMEMEALARDKAKNLGDTHGAVSIDPLEGLTIDSDVMKQNAFDKLNAEDKEGGLELWTKNKRKNLISRKVDDLRRVNPLVGESQAGRTLHNKEVVMDLMNEGYSEADIVQALKRKKELSDLMTKGELTPDEEIRYEQLKEDLFNNPNADLPASVLYSKLGPSPLDVSHKIPLSIASKRRTSWFDQGDINSPRNKDLSSLETQAAGDLWTEASKLLNANPTYQQYSGKMAKYVPLENAIGNRLSILDKNEAFPLDPLKIPLWLFREASRSNPGLKTKYAIGKYLSEHPTALGTGIIPGADELYNQKEESPRLSDTYGVTK